MSAPAPSEFPLSVRNFLDTLATQPPYAAQQKARTSATRLLAGKRGAPAPAPGSVQPFDGKAQEAALLLWEASRRLLEMGEVGSGADLANYLVQVWRSRGVECGKEESAKVRQLIALIGPQGSWRKSFTELVFGWTAAVGNNPSGDADLHGYYGQILFKEGDFHLASLHLILCPTHDAARTLAELMFAWSKLDPDGPSAVGRYAARGALSYLESSSILPARTFLSHFLALALAAHPDLLVVRFPFPPPGSALAKTLPAGAGGDEVVVTALASLNFVQLAVRAAQAGVGESVEKVRNERGELVNAKGGGRALWKGLVSRYEREVAWLREVEAKESTTELGQQYFGIKPPRPAGNPLMDMMANMFGGGGGGGQAAIGR